MYAILQLVSAPLNPRPVVHHFTFLGGATHYVSTATEQTKPAAHERKTELKTEINYLLKNILFPPEFGR